MSENPDKDVQRDLLQFEQTHEPYRRMPMSAGFQHTTCPSEQQSGKGQAFDGIREEPSVSSTGEVQPPFHSSNEVGKESQRSEVAVCKDHIQENKLHSTRARSKEQNVCEGGKPLTVHEDRETDAASRELSDPSATVPTTTTAGVAEKEAETRCEESKPASKGTMTSKEVLTSKDPSSQHDDLHLNEIPTSTRSEISQKRVGIDRPPGTEFKTSTEESKLSSCVIDLKSGESENTNMDTLSSIDKNLSTNVPQEHEPSRSPTQSAIPTGCGSSNVMGSIVRERPRPANRFSVGPIFEIPLSSVTTQNLNRSKETRDVRKSLPPGPTSPKSATVRLSLAEQRATTSPSSDDTEIIGSGSLSVPLSSLEKETYSSLSANENRSTASLAANESKTTASSADNACKTTSTYSVNEQKITTTISTTTVTSEHQGVKQICFQEPEPAIQPGGAVTCPVHQNHCHEIPVPAKINQPALPVQYVIATLQEGESITLVSEQTTRSPPSVWTAPGKSCLKKRHKKCHNDGIPLRFSSQDEVHVYLPDPLANTYTFKKDSSMHGMHLKGFVVDETEEDSGSPSASITDVGTVRFQSNIKAGASNYQRNREDTKSRSQTDRGAIYTPATPGCSRWERPISDNNVNTDSSIVDGVPLDVKMIGVILNYSDVQCRRRCPIKMLPVSSLGVYRSFKIPQPVRYLEEELYDEKDDENFYNQEDGETDDHSCGIFRTLTTPFRRLRKLLCSCFGTRTTN